MKYIPLKYNSRTASIPRGDLPFLGLSGHKWVQPSLNRSPSSIPGADDITYIQLDNGITILSRANFNSPSVSVSGYLAVGSLFDPDNQLGLSYFTASALMRGTANRDFLNLYDELESVGASLGFSGATHTTGFSGKSLSEDLPLLLEIMADAIRNPIFPEQQVTRLKAQLLTSLAIRDQETRAMASLAFNQLVYLDHPYSRPEDGYPETVQKITRKDLIDFHHTHYGPRGMVIAVVGALDPQDAVNQVITLLGDWKNPNQQDVPALPEVKPIKENISKKMEITGKIQADIVIGTAGPPRKSPDYLSAALGNSILGQFGMMGRVGETVREQAGLAYYAYSSISGGIGPGPWAVSAGVNPDNINLAVDLIRQEIRRFSTEPVTSDELSDCKSNLIGSLPLSLESNAGVAGALLNLERFNLGLDYYRRFSSLVNSVTIEGVLDTASKYFDPDAMALGIAGSELNRINAN